MTSVTWRLTLGNAWQAAMVRREFVDFLRAHNYHDWELFDAELAFGEFVSNRFVNRTGKATVQVALIGDEVLVTFLSPESRCPKLGADEGDPVSSLQIIRLLARDYYEEDTALGSKATLVLGLRPRHGDRMDLLSVSPG